MYNKIYSIGIVIVMMAALVAGCASGEDEAEPTTLPPTVVAIDGVVTQDEYDGSMELGGQLTLYWRTADENIVMALVGDTDGMVSIGFDPSVGMKDADMVIAWVEDGELSIFDCYATGASGPHPKDGDLGGQDDIIEAAGSEVDGITTVEFVRPLAASDEYDKDIAPTGATTLIWAYSGSDSFTLKHVNRGTATFEP